MFSLNGKKVLVVGLGKTGLSTIRFINHFFKDAIITATDYRSEDTLPKEFHNLKKNIHHLTIGTHRKKDFDDADVILVSPGVDLNDLSFVPAFSKDIINDIELAHRVSSARFIGITGTNGKSTTTKLVYELLKSIDNNCVLCGNYGNPILDEILKNPHVSTFVCELSSFQLENIVEFSPEITLFLNLSEDHLDRYPNYEEYIRAKERIFMNSDPSSRIIFNYDDLRVREIARKAQGDKFSFSWQKGADIHSDGASIFIAGKHFKEIVFSLENSKLRGKHHIENIMAAVLTALLHRVPSEEIQKVIDSFVGIPHRTEHVREIDGITFYNDSKATNPGATRKALESFEGNIILIAGGRDKGLPLNDLVPLIRKRVKLLLLVGEASFKFYEHFKSLTTCIKCSNFKQSVLESRIRAKKGDIVLLSPACSSYDMFRNFEERGEYFKKLVMEL